MMLRVSVWSAVAMAITGLIAATTDRPYIFPSLGPTALMIFGHPEARTSAPKNVVCGHAAGAACGYFALWVTGMLGLAATPHVTWLRVGASAIALGLTALIMFGLRVEHAPAGATTLLVALGFLPRVEDFLWLMLGVVTLVLLGLTANFRGKKKSGTPY